MADAAVGGIGVELLAALKPYAALLRDGMGGVNASTIDYVCGLTPMQVAGWYAGPMLEAQQRMEAEQKMTATRTEAKTSVPAQPDSMTLAEFKEAFMVPHYADKPTEWWVQKHAGYEAARIASEG